MARTLTNISELSDSFPVERIKILSFSEEVERINKIKYGLGLIYFIGFAIFTSTLLL